MMSGTATVDAGVHFNAHGNLFYLDFCSPSLLHMLFFPIPCGEECYQKRIPFTALRPKMLG